jgi:hypothetical protein
MSNRRRLRAPDRSNSRIRTEVELAQHLGIAAHRLRESATATLDRPVDQAVTIVEAGTVGLRTAEGTRRYRARLIAGDVQGSTGYYGADMLRETARARIFHAGLPIYADHPTETEEAERPERSIRDLAGRLTTDAVYESDGLYADIEVYPMFGPLVEAMADSIGMSIRGSGTAEYGKPEGQRGPLITSIVSAESVDFVTAAGAGGKLVGLLESARTVRVAEARNIEAWFEARLHTDFTQIADGMYGDGRLTREERITLSSAVGDALKAFTARLQAGAPQLASRDPYADLPDAGDDTTVTEARRLREATAEEIRQALCNAVTAAYGDDGPNGYVWVRDYDPDKGVVWYDAPDEGQPQTWQQAYTAAGTPVEVTLADTRTEVVARTVYDPAPPDAEDAAEDPGADAPDIEEAAREVAEAANPVLTDGAPPAASTPTEGEAGMSSGTQHTAAGTTEAAPAPAATVTDATTTSTADAALTESNRRIAEAEARATAAEQRLARADAIAAARPIATSILAESQLPAAARDRVLAQVIESVPLTAANALDEAAFRTAVTEAATEMENFVAGLREGAGEGQVAGLGTSAGAGSADVTATRTKLAERYVARGMSPDAAKIAAAGRP